MVKPLTRNELQQALSLCKSSFITAGVFSMFINLLMLTPAFYMLQTYDRVLSSRSHMTLLMLTLVLLLLLGTMGALEWVRSRVLVRASSKLDNLLGDKMFDASFRQSLQTGGVSNSAQPLQDLNGLRQFMTGNGFFAFFDAPWLPIYIAVMFMFSVWYGVVAIIASIILIVIALFNEKTTAPLIEEASKHQLQAQNVASTNLRNAEVIESMGMLDNIRDRWRTKSQESMYWQSQASDKAGGFSSLSKFFRLSVQSMILGLGAVLVLANEVSPGAMIAGSILLGRALAPIDTLIGSWRQFVTAREQYSRLNKLMDIMPETFEKMSLPAPKGTIRMEQVAIAPPLTKTPAIKGVSFQIEAGEAVAVIGPSASGKSTLARGMLGIWPALAGKVRLDGADINQYNRRELGDYVGYLPQDVELFDGTISENIARFGEVDPDKVVEAARQASVHEMVLQLPDGYDTPIGQGGVGLSAGQRQRIGLARALYGSPVLVVLDEPNSNLDDQGEQALARCIQQLKERGTTTVLITHRPSILSVADRIMVLAEGRVAMFDTRDRIMEAMRKPGGQKQLSAAGSSSHNVTPLS